MEKQFGLDPTFACRLDICPSLSKLTIHFKKFCMAKGIDVVGFIVVTNLLFVYLFGVRNS